MTAAADALHAHLRAALAEWSDSERISARPQSELSLWTAAYEAMATSRQLDVIARRLQAEGRGFYTIASAGHESNALVALALRPTDPALLHYRSGAFYCARAAQLPRSTPIRDVLQGLMGLAEEPIAGGRHKVFGHPDLAIIPQTSTIASHLPRAVGLALALHRAARLGVEPAWPADAVVVCSFGDASVNHSTATGAINTALHSAFRGLPVPLLLVCEDNGFGISVPTPRGWIEQAYGSRPGLTYLAADGSDPAAAWSVINGAVRLAREKRRPVFLHLRTVRYGGHAGSDAEIGYRKPTAIQADQRRDPILAVARELVGCGVPPDRLRDRYEAIGQEVARQAAELANRTPLASAEDVMAPIAPHRPTQVDEAVQHLRPPTPRPPRTLAESINATLADLLERDPRVLVFGEDVGVKGGVYGVTGGLARRFGAARVFDTVLDEQSILGLALGAGLTGLLPIAEIQYLAYLHNAEDQLRGEAASLSFFSSGAFHNPLVLRVPGLGYQKGFGGHFHNDNGLAVLRDVPGLVVACPARGDDAAGVLRSCLAMAAVDGTVSVIVEPIALYHTRDLYRSGDRGWLSQDQGEQVALGSVRCYGQDREPDLLLVTFGNGVPMCLRVANRLRESGITAEVLDLRWLAPLPMTAVLEAAARAGRVLVVDETRHAGGVGEGVLTGLVEAGFLGPLARVASRDSFVPLGTAASHVLLGEDEIEKAAAELAGRERR